MAPCEMHRRESGALPVHQSRHPSVLVIDDDYGTCSTFQWALRRAGFVVETAASGEQGLARIRARSIDLVILDLRLPDMSGTTLIRTLLAERRLPAFLLVSGWLTTQTTVEVVKLGAITVLEKPVDIQQMLNAVRSSIESFELHTLSSDRVESPAMSASWIAHSKRERLWPALPLSPGLSVPTSAAERWAYLVLKACDAAGDLPTLRHWASAVSVSYSALTDASRIIGVAPHDARDFMRLLRALCRTHGRMEHLEAELLISDDRTRRALLQRSGLSSRPQREPDLCPLHEYLTVQSFIEPEHPAVAAINRLVTELL